MQYNRAPLGAAKKRNEFPQRFMTNLVIWSGLFSIIAPDIILVVHTPHRYNYTCSLRDKISNYAEQDIHAVTGSCHELLGVQLVLQVSMHE